MSTTLHTFDPTKTYRRPYMIHAEVTGSTGKDRLTRPPKPHEKGFIKGTRNETTTTGAQRYQEWKQRRAQEEEAH
jgi:hypothetical protein